tara:strand:+ start:5884 stop:6546 length:663 start_codon:yes stop_codon:yes gene_type:complete
MAYYLGRDVKVMLTTESTIRGVKLDGSNELEMTADLSADNFANEMTTAGAATTYAIADLVGVDLSIGTVDEDITYMGQRSVLKTEIKKETSVTLTRKKSGMLYDVVFNGPVADGNEFVDGTHNHGARHGLADDSSGAVKVSNGLMSAKDHSNGTKCTFGYRVYVQLSSGETVSIPNCQITAHTVTLNADGTTEETMEFMSHVTPLIGAAVNVTATSFGDE